MSKGNKPVWNAKWDRGVELCIYKNEKGYALQFRTTWGRGENRKESRTVYLERQLPILLSQMEEAVAYLNAQDDFKQKEKD